MSRIEDPARIGEVDLIAERAWGVKEELKPVYPREDKISFIKKLAETLLKDINISGTVTDNLRYIIN